MPSFGIAHNSAAARVEAHLTCGVIDLVEKRDVVIKTTDSGDLELNTSAGREVAHHPLRGRPDGRAPARSSTFSAV